MADSLTIFVRLLTLLGLLILVLAAIVADLTLVPFMLLVSATQFPCTRIAVDASAVALLRLLGADGPEA